MLPKLRGNQVLVRLIQKEQQKIGNIEIAGHMDREMQQALVLAVGPGVPVVAGYAPAIQDLEPGQMVIIRVRSIRKPAATAPEQITEYRVAFVYKNETLSVFDENLVGMILRQPTEATMAEVDAFNKDA
jgi:co-chaperonin GroES (HSP10)